MSNSIKLPPEQIIIRPPVEAFSILIPVTGGCSWNQCRFCDVYKGTQDYAIRPLDDVLRDIEYYSANYPDHPTVFLAGGNPTSAPTDYLVSIIKYVREKFTKVKRVSCYSKALDIVRKSDEELKKLADAGLDIVYMGLESGSNTILRLMKKGTSAETIIKVGRQLLNAGIKLSLYVILGLGSYEYSQEHVSETARVLTEINPTVFRFRTLNVLENSPLYKDVENGEFIVMKPVDILKEEYSIIKLLGENVTSAVYNDHISNYSNLRSENIKNDKQKLLQILEKLINDPEIQKMEPKHLLHM